ELRKATSLHWKRSGLASLPFWPVISLDGQLGGSEPILIPLHQKYLRTCSDCGYEWEVSRVFVRGFGNKRASDARKSVRVGRNLGYQQGPHYMMQDQAQRDAERSSVEALNAAMRACARCGSPDFSQRPWHKSDRKGT